MSKGKIIKFTDAARPRSREERYKRQRNQLWDMVRQVKEEVSSEYKKAGSWQERWLSSYMDIEEELWVEAKNQKAEEQKNQKQKNDHKLTNRISGMCVGVYCWWVAWLSKGKNRHTNDMA